MTSSSRSSWGRPSVSICMHSVTDLTRLLFFLMAAICFSSSSLSLSFRENRFADFANVLSSVTEIVGCLVGRLSSCRAFSLFVDFVNAASMGCRTLRLAAFSSQAFKPMLTHNTTTIHFEMTGSPTLLVHPSRKPPTARSLLWRNPCSPAVAEMDRKNTGGSMLSVMLRR